MKAIAGIVDGVDWSGRETFIDVDPATGGPLAEVARLGSAEVDAAVEAAQSCWPLYRRRSAADRGGLLRAMARLVRRDADRLAVLESRDVGKPLRQARIDVEVCARYFDFYAGAVQALCGDTLPRMDGVVAFTQPEPLGVTAHITPWNYPLQMAARTVAPALATGNCCVLKPAEDAPLSSVELGRLALEAGFPPGAFNVVPGFGHEAGAALAANGGIDHISFTGSREVGASVAAAAARNIVPATLELGGKSPHLVFDDADLNVAVPTIVTTILQNAGQTCSAGTRLLLHEAVAGEMVDRIAERFRGVTVGRGLDDPDLGPLISDKQRRRVAELVQKGRHEATLVCGGSPLPGEGFFFEPTLFTDVDPFSVIAREEIFGPVLVASTFADEGEAVELANATDYGLVAAVWTANLGRAHRLADDIRAGQVYVNGYGAGGGVELPFGGFKKSGFGREKGLQALLGYTQVKTVVVSTR